MPELRLVTKQTATTTLGKEILMFEKPEAVRPILNSTGWSVFRAFAQGRSYPAKVARELGLYRQKVYYYTKKLSKLGLITEVKEERFKGGIAKLYEASAKGVGVELPFGDVPVLAHQQADRKLREFLSPLVSGGAFDGRIVVGSPEPHGPNKTVARDGHYAIQLGLYLGRFCSVERDFVVRLDVDLKRDREETNNLLLIGGPGTNLITAEINSRLPIRFNEQNYWAGLADRLGRNYSAESEGIIAKVPNPYDSSKRIIVLAGNRHIGTKSAVIALTSFGKELLKNYRGEDEWAAVIRGFDMDADGRIDFVEVIS